MSVQDDKDAGQEDGQQMTEKPEPDEGQKEKAAEMMTAYEDRPTLVLPGTGGMVSGTAVNDWLDDEGNPVGAGDDQVEDQSDDQGHDQVEDQSDDQGQDRRQDKGQDQGDDQDEDQGEDKLTKQEQIDKDKAWNDELRDAAKQENKGEKS